MAGVRGIDGPGPGGDRAGGRWLVASSAWRGGLALCPLLLFLLAVFVYPLGHVLSLSFSTAGGGPGPFRELWASPLYRETLVRTFRISLTVTLACLLLGYPVAYTLAMAPRRWSGVLLTLVVVPFWVSLLGRSFTWLVLLQRHGVVNQVLLSLGLIRQPVPLVYNALGVYIGMVHILLPFMILSLYSVMRGINPSLLRAAANLGASEWQAFRRVYFPLSLPGVTAGAVILFVVGLGFFITPALLGGGKVTMVAMLIEANIHQTLDWPLAAALSLVLLASTILVLVPASRLLDFDRMFGIGRR